MITNNGKDVIRRFFAGQVPQIAGTMVFGTGTTAETVDDVALETEVVRASITSINADLANSRIVFKATLQPGQIPTISEVGLYSSVYFTGSAMITDPLDRSNLLVARTVLDIPQTTDANVPSEIEYSLEINIT